MVDRVDDALHATKAAIESGFLPGGGIALAKVSIDLYNKYKGSESLLESTVAKIVSDACLSPLRQILKNADLSVDFIVENLKQNSDFTYGFNVREEKYCDMIEAGIIDPQKVTATALKNAASGCNSLISIGCVVLGNAVQDQGIQLVQLSDDMY